MTLYFDYSTMLKWSGTPTGVPRTVYCLSYAFREIYPEVKLVGIDDQLGAFHHVNLTSMGARVGKKVEFSKGDVLLSVGANWAFACYNAQVKLFRETGGQFYQLFYDVIPYMFPYFYEQGLGFGDHFGSWIQETLSLCDGGFAISNCTKNDVEQHVKPTLSRHCELNVVRLGEDFNETGDSIVKSEKILNFGNYILAVGTLEVRKNQTCLLNAYRILSRKYPGKLPKLILVGREGWIDGNLLFQVQNDRNLEPLVEILTDTSDQVLQQLYNNCLFTLFPALYEGWGLPVAESLKYGKPCISSNTSSMPEIAPDLTRFASPYSVEEWVKQIEDLLFSQGKLKAETDRICSEYSPTKWTETATKMLTQIRKELNDG
ncbi:glycosyltransferase family 4 protein [Endozoicomonas lisbonensis]